MKIGIITVHKSEVNYGASLQSYALYKFITSLGYDCEVIDLLRPCHDGYRGKSDLGSVIKKYFNRVRFRFWSKEALSLEDKGLVNEKTKKFKKFNSLVRYSTQFKCPVDLNKTPPLYDVYISGSDQIWNPNMPFDNEPYFLTFARKGAKKISYASSFSVSNLTPEIQERYARWLSTYRSLSVRELSGKKIIADLIEKDVPVVLDPTFLILPEEWRTMALPSSIKEDYLFVYTLHGNVELIKYAEKVAKTMGVIPVLIMSSNASSSGDKVKKILNAGPLEWLGMLLNAKMVITDSYHGTIFSILFGVQFFTYFDPDNIPNNVSDRIITLLNTFSAGDRLLDPDFSQSPEELLHIPLNHEGRLKILEMERNKSVDFLIAAIDPSGK